MPGKMYDKIMNYLSLVSEPRPGETIVEIVGDSRLLVENYIEVITYNDEKVEIQVKFGLLNISGDDLLLAYMSDQRLVVNGRILSVSLIRG